MLVKIDRSISKTLILGFEAGRLDGNPPLSHVRLAGPLLHRLTDQRLGLISYLLVRDLLSNELSFEGIEIPSFLAAAIIRDFDGDELFVSPIEKHDRFIVNQKLPRRAQVWGAIQRESDDVSIEVTSTGFVVDAPGVPEAPLTYTTNLPLFLTLAADRPRIVYDVIRALIAFDVVNASALVARSGELPLPELISCVGFSWECRDA